MSDSTLLSLVATSHAIKHANLKEPWLCNCIACRFVKEYKICEENDDINTWAEAIVESMNTKGYTINL